MCLIRNSWPRSGGAFFFGATRTAPASQWGVSRSLLETSRAYFHAYRSQHRDAIPAEFRDPDDLWIGNNLHLLVILQNTKQLPAAQGPHAWSDLLDAKWRGKIAFTDPANS